ncbi:YifB family Mg chelatase-like AAA ATPase [Thiomicrorhabdus aquaedulcis]|uniref:YifB family Mg chelatase-like AAA ATPase n=1 Tax=Thiomicrorhabdus aquaedulcis TaxID=2211106 RepID=UPI000FDA0714|nr:YifB family Mg chelatase-like AAA ATPase [Thiomicrorhabdus aquaedulcis]
MNGSNLAMLATRALSGMVSPEVTVEVHASNGLPGLSLVGLPEASVKESKDRVRSALLSSGFDLPPQRITVNLAPADLPKSGGRYDLAIALGILMATGQLPNMPLVDYEFLGELGLNGELRAVRGVLPSVLAASQAHKITVLPKANQAEAALAVMGKNPAEYLRVAHDLREVCALLLHEHGLLTTTSATSANAGSYSTNTPANLATQPSQADWQALMASHQDTVYEDDLSDIRGQHQAKRVLEICASGGHSLMMVGPPGSGKSMLAARLITLLPILTEQQAVEVAVLRSIAGYDVQAHTLYQRRMLHPHHTASAASIVGGGTVPKPGAVSLAHFGVLFLDELPEFNRAVLEALREPLETKRVEISRVSQQVSFPANCQLITAMNPSPSGFFPDDPLGRCKDTPDQIARYQKKISGPLLDRIDLHLEVPPVDILALQGDSQPDGDTSAVVRQRVTQAQAVQIDRQGCLNSDLSAKALKNLIVLDDLSQKMLAHAVNKMGLSARGYHRILRVARTLADMNSGGETPVSSANIAEALSYRAMHK